MAHEFDYLLEHWQGHRRLTRRVIEAFPPDALFAFTPSKDMRPFADMAREMLGMWRSTLTSIHTGEWKPEMDKNEFGNKKALLEVWDTATEGINELWKQIPAERFHQEEKIWIFPHQPLIGLVHYLIDNEIHHRGQGYVYLRMLEVEPPAFWER